MRKILTVRGPIPPEELGYTSMHEHIFICCNNYRHSSKILPKSRYVDVNDKVTLENVGLINRNIILCWDNLNITDVDLMIAEVGEFKESGGQAIVDMSVPGLRYNIAGVRKVSEATDVHIITSTGFYTQDSWEERFQQMEINNYYQHMMDEVENGIDGTDIKPGHVKIAISHLGPQEEKVLRAGARVAKETGMSITIHPGTMSGGGSCKITDILLDEEKVEPDRVVICHQHTPLMSRNLRELLNNPEASKLDLDTSRYLIERGVNISFEWGGNEFGAEARGYVAVADWISLLAVATLVRQGYCEKIVLATDLCSKNMCRRFGGEGFLRLTDFVVPALREYADLSEFAIHRMTIDNPARILTF